MWSRTELKAKGKLAFKRNYWAAVLVAFVMSLITGTLNTGSSQSYSAGDTDALFITLTEVLPTILCVSVLLLVSNLLIGNALLVGGHRFFVLNQTNPDVKAGTLGYVFKNGHYGNVIKTMFLKDLYTLLWSLLFVIPGIVKFYEYMMVPYILADNPDMSSKEAFAISKRMMMGQKWNAFVLSLSFIGWRILSGLTVGIVGIFYVEPYYQATIAEMYSFNRMFNEKRVS